MNRKYGFTVIEILIVVVVIGILAGIGFVSYNGWRKETVRKAITSDLQNALSAAEQEKNFKGSYPTTLPQSFKSGSPDIVVTVRTIPSSGSAPAAICIEGVNSRQHLQMHIKSTERKVVDGAC